MTGSASTPLGSWPFSIRFAVLATVFVGVAFLPPTYKHLLAAGPVGLFDSVVFQIIHIGVLLTIWIPAIIAKKLGRTITLERLVIAALITAFLAHEVQIRVLGNAFGNWSIFFC